MITGIVSIFPYAVPIAFAHSLNADSNAASAPNKNERFQAMEMTANLLELGKQYNAAQLENRPNILQKLIALAQEREQVLSDLMETDPSAVLDVSLSEDSRQQLPQEAQKHVEVQVSIEGELELLHSDDFEKEISKLYHFLKTPDKTISLHFIGEGPIIPSGSKVAIHGVMIADKVALSSQEGSFDVITVAQTPAKERKVAVILFNFQNNPVQPYTADTARSVVFTASNSANSFYKEISFNKLGLTGYSRADGDVFGWYTVPVDSTNCPYSTASSYARQLAASDGFNINNYDNVQYAFPSTAGCPGWGWAYISGKESWVVGSYQLRVVGHELGHNFGVHHSSSYRCTQNGIPVAISNTCTRSEYGDPFDIMGASTNHMNNFQKGRLNWYELSNTQTVTTAGTYTISQIEKSSTGVQSLRIPRDLDSFGNVLKYYYLEFRQPYGFDSFSLSSPVVNGISIRLAPPYTTVTQTWLLDTTPSTTSFNDASLPVGAIFEDTYKGIAIRTLSTNQESAAVDISFGSGTCVRANPGISISPSSQSGFPGDSLTYSINVSNNDSSACTPSTFVITPLLPAGWSQSPSNSLTLNPGTSTTTTVSVISPTNVASGSYSFSETVNAGAAYSATAQASYNVQVTDTKPPTVTITNPPNGSTLPAKGAQKITVTASDESGIGMIQIFINDVSVKACSSVASCQYNWPMSGVSSGTYNIKAIAQDKAPAGNSNQVSVMVKK